MRLQSRTRLPAFRPMGPQSFLIARRRDVSLFAALSMVLWVMLSAAVVTTYSVATAPAAKALPDGLTCGNRVTHFWGSQTNGSTPSPFTEGGVRGTPSLQSAAPPNTDYTIDTGQFGSATGYIRLSQSAGVPDNTRMPFQLEFNEPVHEFAITVTDVDTVQGDWRDIIRVRAFNGGTEVTDGLQFNLGSNVGQFNNNPPVFAGTGNNTGTSDSADVGISHPGPITRLDIEYFNGQGPQLQVVGIDDPSYCAPQVGAAKSLLSGPNQVGGGLYEATYRMTYRNIGGTALRDPQITDDLAAIFGSPVASPSAPGQYRVSNTNISRNIANTVRLNPSFTGAGGNRGLLDGSTGVIQVGETVAVDVTVQFVPTFSGGNFTASNNATASGDTALNANGSPDGTTTDVSDDGNNVDSNGNGRPNDGNESDPTVFTIAQPGSLAVVKTAGTPVDVNNSGIVDAGDTVLYKFRVTNDGPIRVTNIVVNDPLVGSVRCPSTARNPGQFTTCTANAPYVITEADERAGAVNNTATASGNSARGPVVSPQATATVPVQTPAPGLTIDKAAQTPVDVNGSGLVDAGDTVGYSFTVTNSGNVNLSTIRVADPLLSGVSCASATLAVGATTDCTSDSLYVITEGDEQNGSVTNTATATATDPDGGEVESAPDEAIVDVDTPDPSLEIEKTAGTPDDVNGSGLVDAGDTVPYSFTVTNDGNVPITGVAIDDPLVGAVSCEETELGVGDSTTCTADAVYTVTEDDEDAGEVTNTATASGSDPDGEPAASNEDSTTTEVATPDPSLEVVKSSASPVDVNGSGLVDAGDTIAYSFEVTNDGNVPLTDLTIGDPLVGDVTCDETVLAVGDSTECTGDAVYTITDDDEVAGAVDNAATGSAVDPDGGDVTSPEALASTPVDTPIPELTLVKTAADPVDVNGSGLVDAGDTIAYSFEVSNTGNVDVNTVAVVDPLVGAVSCDETTLAPEDSTDCTADAVYTVTEDDEDAGEVANTATATGTDPDGGPVVSDEGSTTTEVATPDPSLEVVKTAGTPVDVNGSGLVDAGDTIAYSFEVTNDGNVPVTGLTIGDPLVGDVTCDETVLAVGDSTECTGDAVYTITDDDEVAGAVDNTASATATDPDGGDVTSSPAFTSTPVDTPVPELTLVKSAADPVDVNGSGLVDAGDTIAYSFDVSNTGNVDIETLAVVDPLVGAVSCDDTTLAPEDSTECTADAVYTITEDDEDASRVVNTATATGTDPDGGPVVSNEGTTTTEVATPDPSLEVVKTAGAPVDVDGSGLVDAGDTIAYSFEVTNNGNVPVTGVAINDPLVGEVTCDESVLAVGDSTECVGDAVYTITDDDEVAGAADNTATGTALDPDGGDVTSPPAFTSTPVDTPVPELTLDKSAADPVDVNGSGLVDAGDTIAYSFEVTNDGNVPITGVVIDDPLVGDVTCEQSTLAPGDSTDCTADAVYTITDADETDGAVDNTAAATGTDSDSNDVTSPEATTSTPVATPIPELSVVKTASTPVDVNGSGLVDAGDTIAYSFEVTNDGNVPVTAIVVNDPLVGNVTCDDTALAPDAVTGCTGDAVYTITDDDEAAGAVDNTAVATGSDPDGDAVTSPEATTSTPVATPAPQLSLVKSAADPVDVNGSGLVDAGDTIAYSFDVTNDGNVPITGVAIDDPLVGDVTCDETTLDVGDSTDCAADAVYTITTGDEAAGVVDNTAAAAGTDPDGGDVISPGATTSTPVDTPAPSLRVVKTAGTPVDVNGSGLVDAGDTIAYSFEVTNDGNVPITAIVVNDPLVGNVTCDDTALAPDAVTDCTGDAVYTITGDDEAAGAVDNTAVATGSDPDGGDVSSPDAVTSTPVDTPVPSLSVAKTAGAPVDVNGSGLVDAGDTIAYSFTVTNDGNVPVTTVAVTDPLAGDVTCDEATLAPGASTNCTADSTYTITDDDEDSGAVVNTATATGTEPDGGDVTSPEATTETAVSTPAPALTVLKTAAAPVDVNGSGLVDAGDTIAYSFAVTNTGNVPVTSISIVDPVVGAVTCDDTALAPGDSTTCAPETPYVVTPGNEASGTVDNSARATGTDPDDDPVRSPVSVTSTPVDTPNPRLSMTKTAGAPVDVNDSGLVDAGDTIAYSFAVTNTGNVPITAVAISDALIGTVSCEETALAVGASTTCTADAPYVVTEDNESDAEVANSARALGVDPDGVAVRSPQSTTTTPVVTPTPRLALVKTAGEPVDENSSGLVDAGDTIAYTFEVMNTGNVPVSAVGIVDPLVGAVSCVDTELTVGASTLCTSESVYVVTEDDEVSGSVDNLAVAGATDPDGDPVQSPTSRTSTPVDTPGSVLTLVKTAGTPVDVNNSGLVDAGDTIAYTFTVTNEGNVPLTVVGISDPLAGDVTCEDTTLAPDQSTSCAADELYVVTEEDEQSGSVTNRASASAFDPDGGAVSTTLQQSTVTPVQTPAPRLSMMKTAGDPVDVNGSGLVDAGDTIAYTFTVTNEGNVPLTVVGISDPLVGDVTCDPTELGVGESSSCTADEVYVVTEDDEASGSISNTAVATALEPDGDAVRSPVSSTSSTVDSPAPALTLVKSAGSPDDVNGSGLVDAGDTLAYSFTVSNGGNVPLSLVGISDPLVGDVTCAQTELGVGESTSCTADALYVVTEDDEAAGEVDNAAIATAVDPDDGPVQSPVSSTSTPVSTPSPELSVVKTAAAPVDVNGSGLVDAGDTIAYSFEVTNEGNVPVASVGISDALVGDVTCLEDQLDAGESTTCSADDPYVVTEGDEGAGSVANTATATATDPDGDPVESSESNTSTPVATPAPELSVVKTAAAPVDVNGSGLVDAGDTIAYSFEVTNGGNVPVTVVGISDPLVGDVTCGQSQLGVGESTTCTPVALYEVSEGDEAAGSVANTATATATDPDGDVVESPESSTSTPVATPAPELTLVKTAGTPVDVNGSGLVDAGDTIAYSFTATNDGNVPVTGVAITDPLVGNVTCEATTLAVGESTSCTADEAYTITEDGEVSGAADNSASATCTDPDGDSVTSADATTSTVVATPAPELSLVKGAGAPVDVNSSGLVDAGDTIAYSFLVTNEGNVPLTAVEISDPLIGDVACDAAELGVGESTTCTPDQLYVVTEGDEAAGSVANTATATAIDPDGDPVESPEADTSTPVAAPAPELSLTKAAGAPVDVNSSGLVDAGDTIAYTFTVVNEGNVPVTAAAISDALVGGVSCAATELVPGEVTTCAADALYVVTEADEIAGRIDNVATATATDPDGDPVESAVSSTSTAVDTPDSALSVVKSAAAPVDVNSSGLVDAGDTIAYSFAVTNAGNVPVTVVGIVDPLAGEVSCAETELGSGESTTCTPGELYTVTEGDEAAGSVANTATATATDPDGDPVESAVSSTSTAVDTPDSVLSVVKSAAAPVDVNSSGLVDAGDTIAYSFEVTNAGNVPVTVVAISDALVGDVTCAQTELGAGESTTCAADSLYVITEGDEATGEVDNVATAIATDPDGDPVESPVSTTTTPVDTPATELSMVKTAGTPADVNGSGLVDAGDTIAYSFAVTNAGNVPVTVVGIIDPLVGDVTCTETELGVGESTTCTPDELYVVTEGDEAVGSVANTATATATDPDGDPVESPESETSTPINTPAPALALVKTASTPADVNNSGLIDAGDTIAYTFTVTNNGNVPVTRIAITDPLAGDVTCEESALAVGISTDCSADTVYPITGDDEVAGRVENTASATGTDPDGDDVTSPDATTSTDIATPAPALTLVKTAGTPVDVNGSGLIDAGDTIAYAFEITNGGNVPVTVVGITDPLVGDVTCAETELGVDGSTTCTADALYVVTEGDEAAGSVANSASATAVDPDGDPVESLESDTSTPVARPAPELGVVKTAGTPGDVNGSGLVDAGDTIAYTFTVTNDGNVPVTGIAITDALVGDVTCDETTLAVGDSTDCAADSAYVITDDDEVAGRVNNSATVAGSDPDGDVVESPTSTTATPVATPDPQIRMLKTAATPADVNNSALVDAGDTIAYTFLVINEGNVPVTSVAIVDPLVGDVTCVQTELAAVASTTCTPNVLYVVTEGDEAAGTVANTATATATDPDGNPVESLESDTSTPVATPAPELSMIKTAGTPEDVNSSGLVDAGDTIAYAFEVTNDGNVPIAVVSIADPVAGDVTCEVTELGVGESTLCTPDALYVVTEDDEVAGSVDNVATAIGQDPDGGPVESPESSTSTPVDSPVVALSLLKQAQPPVDVNLSGLTDAGDTIAYSFVVTNGGTVPITTVAISDPLVGAVTCAEESLAPGASTTCTADEVYAVTENDEAAGSVDNEATASALDPDGDSVQSDVAVNSIVVSTPAPELALSKTAGAPVDVNSSGLVDAGDTIAYSFVVTNTGNVPVGIPLTVIDPLAGSVTCADDVLAPGQATTCTADNPYVVTQDDERAGTVDNSAVVTGSDPDGEIVTSEVTEQSQTSTPVQTPLAELSMVKTAGTPVDVNSSGLVDAGDTISYSFEVTNEGNVPVTVVGITDPVVGGVTCADTELAVAGVTTCTADALYVVTEADEAVGTVDNVATATATDPNGDQVESPAADTSTPVATPAAALSVVKTAGTPEDVNSSGLVDAGDTIAYSFEVTNDGNVPVTSVAVVDALVGAVTCDATTLAPDAFTECTADVLYVITDDDETAGTVENSATVTGLDPDGGAVVSTESETSTPVATPAAALSVVKAAGTPVDVNGSGLVDAGDTIAYSFTVTNDGNVPVAAVLVADPLAGAVTCDVTTLLPTESANCAADTAYVVTEDDEVAEVVTNVASASGFDPDGAEVETAEATTSTPVATPAPELSVVKSAGTPVDVNSSGLVDAGDTIAYSFVVSNGGNVPITTVAIADPLVGAVTCAASTLAPGVSTSCTADALYVVTQSDEVAGSVDNSATATGLNPDDETVGSEPSTTSTEVGSPFPGLSVAKSAEDPLDVNSSGLVDAGDTIAYSFVVTNDGNVPLSDVSIVDALVGDVTCERTTLAPDASTTCAADEVYVITEGDETATLVTNSATATAIDPDDDDIESLESSVTVPVSTPLPDLSVVKTAGPPVDVNGSGVVDAGDTIAYSFVATNDGNVPVTSVAIVDALVGDATCEATTLAPSDSTNCTADELYVVTDDDEVAGSIDNSATATALDPDDDAVTSLASLTSTLVSTPAPALSLTKTAETPLDVNSSGLVDAGDTIAYSFVVTNDGNVPVAAVLVSDPLVGAVTCDETTLAPGDSADCAADTAYVVTQGDEVAEGVTNLATASGSDPDGGAVTSGDASTSTPVATPTPGLSVVKTAGGPVDANSSGLVDAGDTIAYSFVVTNDGNVPLTSVAIDDGLAGDVTCDETTLAPADSTDCTADELYIVTEADEVAGSVDNSAIATGVDPDSDVVQSSESTTETAIAIPIPEVSLVKTAGTPLDVNGSGLVDAGDTIAYSFLVTNEGNVPLTAVAIADDLVGDVTCDTTTLAPGVATSCTADAPYVVTAGDEAAGTIENAATATAVDPDRDAIESPESVTSTAVATPAPELSLVKTAGNPVDVNDSGLVDAGDTIAYSFVATNEGNVPVTSVAIVDALVGAVTCDATALAPGAFTDCAADEAYVVTDADETAGSVDNSATATARDPETDLVESPESSTETPVAIPTAELSLTKTAGAPFDVNGSGVVDAGDTIAYSFVATNDGNVPITSVAVVDALVGDVTCDETTLAPGGFTDCAADELYPITEGDEVNASVDNTATATAIDPDGGEVASLEAKTQTPVVTPAPALTVLKTAGAPVDVNGSGLVDAGDTIAYSFVVSNAGNVPVTSVGIVDPLAGEITCVDTALAPGLSTSCTADEVYPITEEDQFAGSVDNSASATGVDPDGDSLASASSTTSTDVGSPFPALSLVKTAGEPVDVNASGLVDAGDTVGYSFLVTNEGNVPIGSVAIVDALVGDVTCEATTLTPTASTLCTAEAAYVVTEDDESATTVVNSATATGADPDGDMVESLESSAIVPVSTPAPLISVVKTAGAPVDVNSSGLVDAGDTIAYTFAVTNDGNVPLTSVGIADALVGDVTCDEETLAPGVSTACSPDQVYVVTKADEVSGTVDNSATVIALDPDAGDVVSPSSTTSTPVSTPTPGLRMVKTAGTPVDVNGSGLVDAGDTIGYSFVVTNEGNVPVASVGIVDALVGDVTCEEATLAPQVSTACTADEVYVVTEADEVAGTVDNSATATALDSDGGEVLSPASTTATQVTSPTPALSVVKTAGDPVDGNGSDLVDAGDTIAYSFVVTNAGNVPMTAVAVADDLVGEVTCGAMTLAPGVSTDCAADVYTITDGDEVAGSVENSATVSGVDPDDGGVVSPVSTTLTFVTTASPSLSVLKSARPPIDVNGSGLVDAGDTVAYSFVVTNDGNVPITSLEIIDPLIGDVTCAEVALAVGAGTDCVGDAPYVITEDDEGAASVDNSATASGADPDGGGVVSPVSTVSTPVGVPNPALSLVKTAAPFDANGSGLVDAGDTIQYTFTAENTGNVTVTDLKIVDPLIGSVTCADTQLTAGQETECGANEVYVVTAADEVAGLVSNSATASVVEPDGDEITSFEANAVVGVSAPQVGLSMVKTAAEPVDVDSSGQVDVGDTIAYTFEVTNEGTVPVNSLVIDDPLLGDVTCDDLTLAPGVSTRCEGDEPYTVTDADQRAGAVLNTARATANDPDGIALPAVQDSVTVDTSALTPGLQLVKTATWDDADGDGLGDAGEEITYTFELTNTGESELEALTVVDVMLTDRGVDLDCEIATLAVGQSVVCSAPYAISEADADRATLTNVASATGVALGGVDVLSGPSTATVAMDDSGPILNPTPAPTPDSTPPPGTTALSDPPGGPQESLPRTGSEAWPLLAISGLLLACGSVLLVATRRRRQTEILDADPRLNRQ